MERLSVAGGISACWHTQGEGHRRLIFVPIGLITAVVSGALIACSSATVVVPGADASIPDSGGGQDTSIPDTSAADTAIPCTQPGAIACDSWLDAICGRYDQCCHSSGTCIPSCSGGDAWPCAQNTCRAKYAEIGFNCADAKYASKTVCKAKTDACTKDYALVACSDLIAGTSNTPPSCVAFFAQF